VNHSKRGSLLGKIPEAGQHNSVLSKDLQDSGFEQDAVIFST
jgi:hypothetical protein